MIYIGYPMTKESWDAMWEEEPEGDDGGVMPNMIMIDGVLTTDVGLGLQLFAKANKPNRKWQTCVRCLVAHKPGSHLFYRPMGNPKNRMQRLCSRCADAEIHGGKVT